MYVIQRPVYNESLLRGACLLRRRDSPASSPCQRLAQRLRCSSHRLWACLLSVLPILTWLPSYPVKEYLFSDVVSGLSTGVVQLPQGLAYAMLAALPPVYGLYSSFYPVLLYTFFGTSRHISIGTFAVISLMIGGVVVREVPDSMFLVPPTNVSNASLPVLDVGARDARRVQVAVVLAALVGIIQVVLGLLRFGFVAIYLTEPLVRGFTTAAAVHVFISQLKYLLGVKTQRYSGPLSAIFSVRAVMMDIGSTNVPTVLLGVACMVFLYGTKVLNEHFKKKLPVPVPGEIIVVMASTGISYGLALAHRYQVDVVGKIPSGLLPPSVPHFSLSAALITDAFAIAIVGFSMGISLAKIFALKHGYAVDSNQELIALGLCNFISSFFQTFAITCSMSRSLVQESTGGRTQIAGLLGSLLVLLVVVAIGFVFQPLPQTALAAIIMVNLLGMFKQFRDIPHLWRTSRLELLIWLVAFVASVLLGLDYGLLVALTFALLTVLYRTQSPKASLLGHVSSSSGLYWDVEEYEEAVEVEGMKIFHFNSSVYFANCDLYVSSLKDKAGVNLCPRGGVQKSPPTNRMRRRRRRSKECPPPLHSCVTYQEDSAPAQGASPQLKNSLRLLPGSSSSPEEVSLRPMGGAVHSLVLDWTSVSFVDSVGAKAVTQVVKEYNAVGVAVVIAGCNRHVLAELERLQFFSGVLDLDLVFPTVHDAVLRCTQGHAPCREAPPPAQGEEEEEDMPWRRSQRDIL